MYHMESQHECEDDVEEELYVYKLNCFVKHVTHVGLKDFASQYFRVFRSY